MISIKDRLKAQLASMSTQQSPDAPTLTSRKPTIQIFCKKNKPSHSTSTPDVVVDTTSTMIESGALYSLKWFGCVNNEGIRKATKVVLENMRVNDEGEVLLEEEAWPAVKTLVTFKHRVLLNESVWLLMALTLNGNNRVIEHIGWYNILRVTKVSAVGGICLLAALALHDNWGEKVIKEQSKYIMDTAQRLKDEPDYSKNVVLICRSFAYISLTKLGSIQLTKNGIFDIITDFLWESNSELLKATVVLMRNLSFSTSAKVKSELVRQGLLSTILNLINPNLPQEVLEPICIALSNLTIEPNDELLSTYWVWISSPNIELKNCALSGLCNIVEKHVDTLFLKNPDILNNLQQVLQESSDNPLFEACHQAATNLINILNKDNAPPADDPPPPVESPPPPEEAPPPPNPPTTEAPFAIAFSQITNNALSSSSSTSTNTSTNTNTSTTAASGALNRSEDEIRKSRKASRLSTGISRSTLRNSFRKPPKKNSEEEIISEKEKGEKEKKEKEKNDKEKIEKDKLDSSLPDKKRQLNPAISKISKRKSMSHMSRKVQKRDEDKKSESSTNTTTPPPPDKKSRRMSQKVRRDSTFEKKFS